MLSKRLSNGFHGFCDALAFGTRLGGIIFSAVIALQRLSPLTITLHRVIWAVLVLLVVVRLPWKN